MRYLSDGVRFKTNLQNLSQGGVSNALTGMQSHFSYPQSTLST